MSRRSPRLASPKKQKARERTKKKYRRRDHEPGESYRDGIQQGLEPTVAGNCPQETEAEEERRNDSEFIQENTDPPLGQSLWPRFHKKQLPGPKGKAWNEKQASAAKHEAAIVRVTIRRLRVWHHLQSVRQKLEKPCQFLSAGVVVEAGLVRLDFGVTWIIGQRFGNNH